MHIGDYFNITQNNTVQGNIRLDNQSTTNPAFIESYKAGSEFNQLKYNKIFIKSGAKEVEFINDGNAGVITIDGDNILTCYAGTAPETTFAPSTDNSLVNRIYAEDNFLQQSGGEIDGNLSITELLNVGIDGNGDSTIRFNYDSIAGPGNAAIIFDNSSNTFKVNLLGSEKYTVYHEGNLNPNLFLNKLESSVIRGSLSLDSQDINAPATLMVNNAGNYISLKDTGITFSKNVNTDILLTDTNELQLFVNSTKAMELTDSSASVFFTPSTDNHITNKKFVDDNFISQNGGTISGNIIVDSTNTGTGKILLVSDESNNENNSISFIRPDDTYRFSIFNNIDESGTNLITYDTDGATFNNVTTLLADGNIKIKDGTIPNADYHLTTKKYTDDLLIEKADSIYVDTRFNEKFDKTGGDVNGPINIIGANLTVTAAGSIPASIFFKSDANMIKASLQVDLVTGELEITGSTRFLSAPKSDTSPVDAEDLTTKDYVDTVVVALADEVHSQDVDYTKVFDYSQSTGNTLSRAELEDICQEHLGVNTPNNNIAFVVCTADDKWFIVRYVHSHDKFIYEKLSAR